MIPVPIKNLQRIQDPVIRGALDEIRRNLEILYGEPNATLVNLKKKAITYGDALDLQLLAFEKVGGQFRFLANLGSIEDASFKEQKSYIPGGTPAGTPGGVDTQLQFNDGGFFGGASGLTWAKASSLLKLNDNVILVLGTGRDLDFYHNGTNNIIKLINGELQVGDGAGTNHTAFELTRAGFMRAGGNARAWRDFNFGLVQLALGAAAPGRVTIGGGSIEYLGFDGNVTTEAVSGSIEIDHDWVEETDITFHVHCIQTSVNTGVVKWQLAYAWHNTEGAMAALPAETIISATVNFNGTTGDGYVVDFPAISGAGKKVGSQFNFRLFRDPTDAADTYPDDAATETAGIHALIDTLGSRQMTAK